MLAGLREPKLSRSKRIKVCYFPGGKTEDLQHHIIPYLKKKPDNIIIHIGTNDSPYKTEDFMYKEFVKVKKTINKCHLNCKNIAISSPHHLLFEQIRRRITYLKHTTTFWNRKKGISASHLHRDGLHLNLNVTIMLAGNLLSRTLTFWYNLDSNKETNLSNNHNGNKIISSSNYKSLINDNSAILLGLF